MERGQTLMEKIGLMDVERAAACLGVTVAYFRARVSPFIGKTIMGKKYFTEPELELWLREQIGETNISKETEEAKQKVS